MNLKVNDLCELIKVCGASGVVELKFNELHVQFASKAPEQVVSGFELPITTNQVETEQQVILRDEIKTKRDQVDLMMIDNPLEYERLLMSGELEDEEAQH